MSADILALDVGTSALKAGVFGPGLEKRREAHRAYQPRLYDRGSAEIDPETWWGALRACCDELAGTLAHVGVISLSVTTPGLTPMADDGTALAPAVLFFDSRSRAQSAAIRGIVGERKFLAETCNLPVSGGSSLSSILWFRDELPGVWARAAKFGHCNTYLVKRMTGAWAIDPSTTSITGLYNTARNDLTWNREILDLAGIAEDRLPPLMESSEPAGRLRDRVAEELGLPHGCTVLCGGNDAVLASLSGGLTEPGDVNVISGTCDIATVCIDRPVASPDFNVRCHVVPGRWLTFFILNAGGSGLDWFRRVFCADMDDEQFYGTYMPDVLSRFLASSDVDAHEAELPTFVPHLGGSRYSLERLKATFDGLTLETTRDDLLLSVVRGNMAYLGRHLREISGLVSLSGRVGLSGGGTTIRGTLEARRRWTGAYEYLLQDQSSMLGAAMLGQAYLARTSPRSGDITVEVGQEAGR